MIFKTVNGGKMPTRGTKYSACVDLYANEDVVIGAGETKLIPLGVAIDIDKIKAMFKASNWFHEEEFDGFMRTHYLQLMSRSSLGKKGLVVPHGVGIIDIDYPDEIMLQVTGIITNVDCVEDTIWGGYTIKKGDRVAQITLLKHYSHLFGIESDEDRDGGFGSTDKKEK